MDVAAPIILALSVALALAAIVWVWRLRRGNTTVQRWQSTLPWAAWIVLVGALAASFVADVAAVRTVMLLAFGALLLAAIALGLLSWLQRRNARARDLELGLPSLPPRPGLIRSYLLVPAIAFVFMMLVLPWLALMMASPPYPNLLTTSSLFTLMFIGIALGVAAAAVRWIVYGIRRRDYDTLVAGIERRVADAAGTATS